MQSNDAPAPISDDEVARLRRRYAEERDKRQRSDRENQYTEAVGEFASFVDTDPHAEHVERDPLTRTPTVLVVGGGFSGLMAGARLRENGVEDFLIVEAGADFGGTWYWNRYPGAQCDTDSYCYLPLLEETGYVPKEKYSYGDEIREHSQRVGRHFGLYERTLFGTRVLDMAWDDAAAHWRVHTDRDDDITARYVIMATGIANRAKLPGIPGINDFTGRMFHTARWDYDYTGGDLHGGLHKLADKRVAVIGTGATGVQVVPHLARDAGRVYVFQRTPSSVDLRGNRPTDPGWAASLEPGWQARRRDNYADILDGKPFTEDLVDDGWTDVFQKLSFTMGPGTTPEQFARSFEQADLAKMNEIRARVADVVTDPATAAKLQPWYSQFCKRPTFSDEFLPAFNRPNVTLVDTAPSKGIERITERGVVAGGVEYEVDLIVFATGFQITVADYRKVIGFEVTGRGGVSLYDHWAKGLTTLHGHSTHDFPNWFYIGLTQNALSPNMGHMYEVQTRHVGHIVGELVARGARTVEADPQAEQAWGEHVRSVAVDRTAFLDGCTPGWYNNEGSTEGRIYDQLYAPGITTFDTLLGDWRAAGTFEGLRITTGAPSDSPSDTVPTSGE